MRVWSLFFPDIALILATFFVTIFRDVFCQSVGGAVCFKVKNKFLDKLSPETREKNPRSIESLPQTADLPGLRNGVFLELAERKLEILRIITIQQFKGCSTRVNVLLRIFLC